MARAFLTVAFDQLRTTAEAATPNETCIPQPEHEQLCAIRAGCCTNGGLKSSVAHDPASPRRMSNPSLIFTGGEVWERSPMQIRAWIAKQGLGNLP